jgi:dihydrofolate reductase
MRRIVMFNQLTADGFFAGVDGGLDWVTADETFDEEAAESSKDTDALIFGRKTYQMFESFWPNAAKQEEAPDPHHPGRASKAIQRIARSIDDAEKIVFSRTLSQVTWKGSRLLKEFDAKEIERLKRAPGKTIMVFGSGSIVAQLLEHGLIDELMFSVSPVILGRGRTMLGSLEERTKLKLLEAKAYASGNVVLRYSPAR